MTSKKVCPKGSNKEFTPEHGLHLVWILKKGTIWDNAIKEKREKGKGE